jgi:hypothetical protein
MERFLLVLGIWNLYPHPAVLSSKIYTSRFQKGLGRAFREAKAFFHKMTFIMLKCSKLVMAHGLAAGL